MIDLIITANKNVFEDIKAIPAASADSDHQMVVAKLNMTKPNRKEDKSRQDQVGKP